MDCLTTCYHHTADYKKTSSYHHLIHHRLHRQTRGWHKRYSHQDNTGFDFVTTVAMAEPMVESVVIVVVEALVEPVVVEPLVAAVLVVTLMVVVLVEPMAGAVHKAEPADDADHKAVNLMYPAQYTVEVHHHYHNHHHDDHDDENENENDDDHYYYNHERGISLSALKIELKSIKEEITNTK